MAISKLAVFAASIAAVDALNNGVGLLPQLGFNSWYALHSHLTYPNYTWMPGFVLSNAMTDIAQWFITSGLSNLGYKYMNVDDCIVISRDPVTGQLVPDPQAFPNGVRPYTQGLNGLGFKAGFYSDRGNYTCSCYAGGPKRPGSRGHEAQDAATWASWGLEEIKVDSCNDNGVNNTGALEQYAMMRDGLNATGVPILFDICWGAGATIAQPGRSLGNEWRIDEDDGSGWAAIMQNVYTDAGLTAYSGCEGSAHGADGFGCGWNDPGLLLVGQADLSDVQGRAHMSLWAMLASKLLISVDPRNFTAASMETVSNPEVIAIDQDPIGLQAVRIVPAADPARVMRDLATRREYFSRPEHAHIPKTAKYSMVAKAHSAWPEGEPLSRGDVIVPGTEAAEVQAVGGRPEVWMRKLAGGDVALLLFNNNMTGPASISCTDSCFAALGFSPAVTIAVRDLWARTDNGTTTAAAGVVVDGIPTDGVVLLRLHQVQASADAVRTAVAAVTDSAASRSEDGDQPAQAQAGQADAQPLHLSYYWRYA